MWEDKNENELKRTKKNQKSTAKMITDNSETSKKGIVATKRRPLTTTSTTTTRNVAVVFAAGKAARSTSGATTSLGAIKVTILWPLVLYSLIQISANLTQDKLSYLSQQDNQSIAAVNNIDINSHQDCRTTASQYLAQNLQLQISSNINHYLKSSCSSPSSSAQIISSKIQATHKSLSPSTATNSIKYYLSPLFKFFNQHESTIFGGRILFAQATASSYHPQQDKEIIILNSTNFNTELIQYKFPFPHLKLIEYYLLFCNFCNKFKTTYTKLAKEIYPWRNVMRPSAIDLGIANNSPIAHSWSVEIVPTLRIHPPPTPDLAEKLHEQFMSLNKTLAQNEIQKPMYEEYKKANLMLHTLSAAKYLDNVLLLKSDLLLYVERYVRETPSSELPVSWPNLKPVNEKTLIELLQNHPRQELFLIIEPGKTTTYGSDQSQGISNLGLAVMMELSSSTAWKATRYVSASENKDLIHDVIEQQIKRAEKQSFDAEQMELLKNTFLTEAATTSSNNIVLLHIDDSHSPAKTAKLLSNSSPLVTVVTGANLISVEQSILKDQHASYQVRRETNQARTRRSSFDSDNSAFNKLSGERKAELMALYIKHTYTETSEDRDFVKAINNLDDNSGQEGEVVESVNTSSRGNNNNNNKSAEKISKAQQSNLSKSPISSERDSDSTTQDQSQSLLTKIYNVVNRPADKKGRQLSYSSLTDYNDKLKAIRYILFNEVPRSAMSAKSLVEQQEKLNILVNLVTVIKSYFPLPDLSSTQFIDGVHSYLLKQQSRLSSVNTQQDGVTSGFDTHAFKQELKRLENEDKRLPEIKDWKHCKHTGYPCALWRLFHTMSAFEYKKLVQIRQPQSPQASLSQPATTGLQQQDSGLSPTVEAITMNSTSSNGPPSPVERLVSPPSMITSSSLTIATPTLPDNNNGGNSSNNNYYKPLTEADLPMPVILVMRDYITSFFTCKECALNFRSEASDLSLERIRHQEPAEFSILWLWETHNRVNKRLSVDPETNPHEHPKIWFPTYKQCSVCYKKPPSFLKVTTIDATIFHESIDWNRQEVLCFLIREYTKQPMDNHTNIFGYQVPYGLGLIFVTCVCCVILIVVLRCTTLYIERQKRHKANFLNGNGAYDPVEMH